MLSLQVYKLHLYKDIDLLLRIKIIPYYKIRFKYCSKLIYYEEKYKI